MMVLPLSTVLATLLWTSPTVPAPDPEPTPPPAEFDPDPRPADPPTNGDSTPPTATEDPPPQQPGVRVTVDDEELLLPDGLVNQVAQRLTETLLEHDIDPATFSLRIIWHDRNAIQHGIRLYGPEGFQASEVCAGCSESALLEKVLVLVEQAAATQQARAQASARAQSLAPQLPPPPPVAPPPPRDRHWPIRRGFAAALTAAGGAGVATGVGLIIAKKHVFQIDRSEQGEVHHWRDLQVPGYVVLGIGAGVLVGGTVWLVVEQTRRRKSLGKDAQSRIEPGIGSMTIRF